MRLRPAALLLFVCWFEALAAEPAPNWNTPGTERTILSFAIVVLLALAALLWRGIRTARRAAEAFRLAFDGAADAIVITSSTLQIEEANPRACEFLGYSRDELARMNVRDLVLQDDLVNKPFKFEDVLAKRQTVVQERRFRRKDGSVVSVEVTVRALSDGRLAALAHDVTERRREEKAGDDHEALTRSVVYTALDGIITADEHGIIQSFNPAAERLFGYSASEAVGKNLSSLMPSPDREHHDGHIRRYLETGVRRVIGIGREVTALRKDGTTVPVELAVSEMLLPGRRLFTGILRDITERKRAEAEMKAVNTKLQAVIETSPLAVIVLDFAGVVHGWNEAAERIFGFTAGEVMDRPLPAVAETDWAEFLRSLAVTAEGITQSGIEYTHLRKDGSPVTVSIWTAPLRNPEGDVTAVLRIAADMTQRRLLEDQFRHAQKMEAVGRLAGGIAHDFNNILTVITGYGQMMADRLAEDPQLRSELDEILKAADHAASLTSQLLIFSRQQVVNRELIDLNGVIAKLEKMLGRIIGEDITLTVIPQQGLGLVRADVAQIEQVIMNLAVNARDAMPNGGRLTIETANVELDATYTQSHIGVSEGDYVMLAVSDSGKGIPPNVRTRLFEPFFTTKERGKGTGLGLSTVYGIVKQSGGTIWVYSEPERGTTFKVYLPHVREEASQQPAVEAQPLPPAVETVLLVEDETGVRALVRDVLRQQGYKVLDAADVDDALRLCREYEGEIHLLLTDVVMPIMSGRELAERAASIRPNLKVLYMSGYTDNIVVHHGVTTGNTQFLQKPFTPKALARKVRDVLDRTE